jgi:hypothetical protein
MTARKRSSSFGINFIQHHVALNSRPLALVLAGIFSLAGSFFSPGVTLEHHSPAVAIPQQADKNHLNRLRHICDATTGSILG